MPLIIPHKYVTPMPPCAFVITPKEGVIPTCRLGTNSVHSRTVTCHCDGPSICKLLEHACKHGPLVESVASIASSKVFLNSSLRKLHSAMGSNMYRSLIYMGYVTSLVDMEKFVIKQCSVVSRRMSRTGRIVSCLPLSLILRLRSTQPKRYHDEANLFIALSLVAGSGTSSASSVRPVASPRG